MIKKKIEQNSFNIKTFHNLISIQKLKKGKHVYRAETLCLGISLHVGSRVIELSELLIENDKGTYYKIRNSKLSQKAVPDNIMY